MKKTNFMKKAKLKKKVAKKRVAAPKLKLLKPIGEIKHFYGNIKVAIVKFLKPVKVGAKLEIRGATTNFIFTVGSMQFDHKPITQAKPKALVGIKVPKRVREGDGVFVAK
jgi:hypothetical protein